MADVEEACEVVPVGSYDWRVGAFQNQGGQASTTPGWFGTPYSPGVVGAPSSSSKLVRCGLSMSMAVAGTNSGAIISPDWMAQQSGYVVAAAQTAGDATVPSPTNPAPVNYKVSEALEERPVSFGFTTPQGFTTLRTKGLVWSKGEDLSPPGAGLQVRVGFSGNDATAGILVFGSAWRWRYTVMLRVLWYTP